jgi:hypothetical protein
MPAQYAPGETRNASLAPPSAAAAAAALMPPRPSFVMPPFGLDTTKNYESQKAEYYALYDALVRSVQSRRPDAAPAPTTHAKTRAIQAADAGRSPQAGRSADGGLQDSGTKLAARASARLIDGPGGLVLLPAAAYVVGQDGTVASGMVDGLASADDLDMEAWSRAQAMTVDRQLVEQFPTAPLLHGVKLVVARDPRDPDVQDQVVFWSRIMGDHMDFIDQLLTRVGATHTPRGWLSTARANIANAAKSLRVLWYRHAAEQAQTAEVTTVALDRLAELLAATAYVKLYALLLTKAWGQLGDLKMDLLVEILGELGYFYSQLNGTNTPKDQLRFWTAHGFDHASLEQAVLSKDEAGMIAVARQLVARFDEANALAASVGTADRSGQVDLTVALGQAAVAANAAQQASFDYLSLLDKEAAVTVFTRKSVTPEAPVGLADHTKRELTEGLKRVRLALIELQEGTQAAEFGSLEDSDDDDDNDDDSEDDGPGPGQNSACRRARGGGGNNDDDDNDGPNGSGNYQQFIVGPGAVRRVTWSPSPVA